MIWQADLVVLVADSNMQAAVRGLLSRPESLGIRSVQFNIFVHVERDPGCFHRGHDFLRSMANRYEHGLILFDRMGSGQENQGREELEKSVNGRLSIYGWNERAATIVLDPELEVWVWTESPEVGRCLGWKGQPDMRSLLSSKGMWQEGHAKPDNPKKAIEFVLRYTNKPRSSSIYESLAQNVSFQKCTDPAFIKFKEVLRNWFPKSA
jgi:hypothetical protein